MKVFAVSYIGELEYYMDQFRSTVPVLTCTVVAGTKGRQTFLSAGATKGTQMPVMAIPRPPTTPRAGLSKCVTAPAPYLTRYNQPHPLGGPTPGVLGELSLQLHALLAALAAVRGFGLGIYTVNYLPTFEHVCKIPV